MVNMEKRRGQKAHARRRAMERYGLKLVNADFPRICEMIRWKINARFIKRESTRISIWKIWYRDREMNIAYDDLRESIASFLPLIDLRPDNVEPHPTP